MVTIMARPSTKIMKARDRRSALLAKSSLITQWAETKEEATTSTSSRMFRRRAKKKVGPVGTGIWRRQLPSILDDAAQDDARLATAEAMTLLQRRQHRRQKSQQDRGKGRRPSQSQERQDEPRDLGTEFSRGETHSTAGTASTSSDGSSSNSSPAAPREYTGFRSDYKLGNIIRDASHMIVHPAPGEALKNHDHVFLKRSDGSHTYAILAFRTDKQMIFVTDGTGKRKEVGRRRWAEFVALVAPEEKNQADDMLDEAVEEPSPAQDDTSDCSDNLSLECRRRSASSADDDNKDAYKRHLLKKDWIPPEVAFSPHDDADDVDDECSSISDIDVRKRRTPEEEELEWEAKKFVSDCIGGKAKHGGGGDGGYLPWERYTTPEYILRNPLLR